MNVRHSLRALFVAALLVSLSACVNLKPEGKVQSVQDATNAWREAFDRHDATRLAGLYDNDAVLWGTIATTPVTTNTGLIEYFTRATAAPEATVIINGTYIRELGNVATNSGTYTFQTKVDGQIVARPARFTFTYRKVDGNWLIIAHHSSLMPK